MTRETTKQPRKKPGPKGPWQSPRLKKVHRKSASLPTYLVDEAELEAVTLAGKNYSRVIQAALEHWLTLPRPTRQAAYELLGAGQHHNL